MLAGFTVALVGLPQCLAYALMSGLPPAYGLSTAAVAGLLAALLGRSAQVVTGPTNTTGLLILGALLPFLASNGLLRPDAIRVLATLTLLAGLIRVLVALGGGAHLIRLIPDSVLVGFTAGVGILIAVMQLDEALGLDPARAVSFLGQISEIEHQLRDIRWPAVAVTLGTVALLHFGSRWFPRIPFALLTITAATAAAWLLNLDQSSGLPLVRDRGALPGGWPPIAIPDLSPGLIQSLFIPAAAIVLLGTLELTVTARAGGERPDMRREIFAQGVANVGGAFAGGFPASASLTRSALLRMSGARTRVAPATAAIISGVALILGGNLAGLIPQASLAGVLLFTAARMLDWKGMLRLWNASHETKVLLVETFVASLILPLEWAILLGSATGLVIHIANTSAPRLRLLRPEGDRLMPVDPAEKPEVVILQVSGNLHYAAVTPFLDEVGTIIPSSVRLVIMDLSHAHEIRFAALRALERLAEEMRRDGAELCLAGVDADTAGLLQRSESPLRWFPDEPVPGRSIWRCLESRSTGGRAAAEPPPFSGQKPKE